MMDISMPLPWFPHQTEMIDCIFMDTFEAHSSDDFSLDDLLATLDSPDDNSPNSSSSEIKLSSSDPWFTPTNCVTENFAELFWEETAIENQGISSISDHTASLTLTFDPFRSTDISGVRLNGVNAEGGVSPNVLVSPSSEHGSLSHTDLAAVMNETTKRFRRVRDNIAAERKRRQKLSQLFVALSAMIPGLKKVDKSTVLEETIRYIKHLQAEEKKLESDSEMRGGCSKIIVKKSQLLIDEDGNGSAEDNSDQNASYIELPEIEARIAEKNILFRIHCMNYEGAVENVLSEIKKYSLSVMNTSAQPYGAYALEITIIAKMEDGFCTSMEQLVRSLRSTI